MNNNNRRKNYYNNNSNSNRNHNHNHNHNHNRNRNHNDKNNRLKKFNFDCSSWSELHYNCVNGFTINAVNLIKSGNSIKYITYNNNTRVPLMKLMQPQKLPTLWSQILESDPNYPGYNWYQAKQIGTLQKMHQQLFRQMNKLFIITLRMQTSLHVY